jgi:UDP-N-acetylmuramate--alanine ligase
MVAVAQCKLSSSCCERTKYSKYRCHPTLYLSLLADMNPRPRYSTLPSSGTYAAVMHVFFAGLGGAGIGPLAMLAKDAGYRVSGSDTAQSPYLNLLERHGIDSVSLHQDGSFIAATHAAHPIDWYVYSSAVAIENPSCGEFAFCRAMGIRMTRRAELLNYLIEQRAMSLIAIAGTHGKTTTTAMIVWLFKELGVPVSYSVGGKISFGRMGELNVGSTFFVYEACEYDRNFLEFRPYIAAISGIDWDHPDTYPTRLVYEEAFRNFLDGSQRRVMWQSDWDRLAYRNNSLILDELRAGDDLHLIGAVNRRNARVAQAVVQLATGIPDKQLAALINRFPGVERRFERVTEGIYSDYAHTIVKIRGALQVATEIAAGRPIIVVYEGMQNIRQHFIRHKLADVFEDVMRLYIVPTYLGREDPTLEVLSPDQIGKGLNERTRVFTTATNLGPTLKSAIANHVSAGDLVLCLSGGGVGSLDQWVRVEFAT